MSENTGGTNASAALVLEIVTRGVDLDALDRKLKQLGSGAKVQVADEASVARIRELSAAVETSQRHIETLQAKLDGLKGTNQSVARSISDLSERTKNAAKGQMQHYEMISRSAKATSSSIKSAMEAITAQRPASTAMATYYSSLERSLPILKEVEARTKAWNASTSQRVQAAVAGLTAENKELSKMRDYYRALESQDVAASVKRLRAESEAEKKRDEARVRAASRVVRARQEAEASYTAWWARELEKREKLEKRSGNSQIGGSTQIAALQSNAAGSSAQVASGFRVVGEAARTTSKNTQQLGTHTHALTLAQQALHASLRGVTGVLGGLWLSYAKLVPVLLATAAATKAVKDSFSAGLELNFLSQFVAVVETAGKSSTEALRELRNSIATDLVEVSRDSVFTTQENAQALQKLALAGVDSARGLKLLRTASDAAVFGQTSLAEATGMVLDTLYNFNLASTDQIIMADNFNKVGNVMAYTATTVNTTFSDLARAFQNITGVAGTFNIEIEEASALLQSLAEAGVRGQKAGTYVRNFLDDMLGAPVSKKAASRFAELGVERFNPDDYGQFGVSQYIDNLVGKIKELDFVQQQSIIKDITNQRSRRVLRQELIKSYEHESSLLRRVQQLSEKAKGSLNEMSTALRDNGRYSLLMAQSAYNATITAAFQDAVADETFQRIGEQLKNLFNSQEFNEMVTGMVRGVADLLESLTSLASWAVRNKDTLADALQLAAVPILATTAIAALNKLYGAYMLVRNGILAVSAVRGAAMLAALSNPITALVTALTVATGAWYAFGRAKDEALSSPEAAQSYVNRLREEINSLASAASDEGEDGYYTRRLRKKEKELEQFLKSREGASRMNEAVGKTLASEIKATVDIYAETLTNIRVAADRLIREGTLGRGERNSYLTTEFRRNLQSIEQDMDKYSARIEDLRAKNADSKAISESVRQFTALAEEQERALRALESTIDSSIYSKLPEMIRDSLTKSRQEVRQKLDELRDEFKDAQFSDDESAFVSLAGLKEGLSAYLKIAEEGAARLNDLKAKMMTASGDSYVQEYQNLLLQQQGLQDVIDLTRERISLEESLARAKAIAAGKDVRTAEDYLGMSATQIEGVSLALEYQARILGMNEEALKNKAKAEIDAAIATLEHQRAEAFFTGDDSRLKALHDRIAALEKLKAATSALYVAQAAANKSRSSGRTDEDRLARDAATSARRVAEQEMKQSRLSADLIEKELGLLREQRLISESQYNDALHRLAMQRAEQAADAAEREVSEIRKRLQDPKLTKVGRAQLENSLKEAQARLNTEQADAAFGRREQQIAYEKKQTESINRHIDALMKLNTERQLALQFDLDSYRLSQEVDPVKIAGIKAQVAAMREYSDLIADLHRDIAANADNPTQLGKLQEQLAKAIADMSAAGAAARGQAERIAADQMTPMAGILDALKEINREATDLASTFKDGLTGSLDIAAQGFATFAATGKLNVRSMVQDMLVYLSKLLAHKAFMMLANVALNALMPSSTGSSKYSLSSGTNLSSMGGGQGLIVNNARGNAFDGSSRGITAFARGGAFGNGEILTQPTLFRFAAGGSFRTGVAGEAGPEGALPLKRMKNGKLGVYAEQSGGGVVIHQQFNVTVQGGGANGQGQGEAISKELRQSMKTAVIEVLNDQKRFGGALA